MESVEFFCSGSVKPENHSLFALNLTSNMKKEAIRQMREVNNNYKKNEMKYKAEGKTLCHIQHEEYISFYQYFIKYKKGLTAILMVALFKETIKVKQFTLTPVMNLLLIRYIAFSQIYISL